MSDHNFRDLLQGAVNEFKEDHLGMAGSLEDMTIEERADLYATLEQDEPHDMIFECADGNVPVYTWDIMQYAANNTNMATNEPELGAAFDGTPTPVNIIAANIFEAIEAELWEWWNDNRTDLMDELEELGIEEEEAL